MTVDIQGYFDEASKTWDQRAQADGSKLDCILAAIAFPQNAAVLDIACGTGVMFQPILRRRPVLLRAIDISPGMIAAAKSKALLIPNIKLSVDDFYTFEETGFDIAILYNAYPHFADKPLLVQRLHRCLRTGGRFLVAHGSGRHEINARHDHLPGAATLSIPLKACEEEAKWFTHLFTIDMAVDLPDRYILSGIKV